MGYSCRSSQGSLHVGTSAIPRPPEVGRFDFCKTSVQDISKRRSGPNPFPTSIPARSMKPIRKAVFPVAGLGTRFLPATKAMRKERLPVVGRPLIQHVVDEARAAGIEHFIFVTGRNKGVIEDHFDLQYELQRTLEERGNKKAELTALAEAQPAAGATSFTRQQAPL